MGLYAAKIKYSYSDENENLVIALSTETCVGFPVTKPKSTDILVHFTKVFLVLPLVPLKMVLLRKDDCLYCWHNLTQFAVYHVIDTSSAQQCQMGGVQTREYEIRAGW